MYDQLVLFMQACFFHAWLEFETCFHFRPTTMQNNLLRSPIFFYPWIFRNPQVKDFTSYRDKDKARLKPEAFDLSNTDCKHWIVLYLLDEKGFKPLKTLKDDPGFRNLNFLPYPRLKLQLEALKARNPGLALKSTGVTLTSGKKIRLNMTTFHV